MSVKFASGREPSLGRSLAYSTPIALPVGYYKGAVVAGEDQLMHYSTGEEWVGLAPVLSTLIDGGNAATVFVGAAKIDLGSAQT